MSSATGVPAENPATERTAEDEPLLGRAGDASQQGGKPIAWNFVLGMFLRLLAEKDEKSTDGFEQSQILKRVLC